LQIGRQFVASTHVDQQLNNRRIELFWELLANPANKGGEYTYNLHQLIKDYPQSSFLQALLVYTGDEESLQHAAVYNNPRLLYKLAHNSEGLAVVDPSQIINLNHLPANEYSQYTQAEESSSPAYQFNDTIPPVYEAHSDEHLLVPHEDSTDTESELTETSELLLTEVAQDEEPATEKLLLPEYSEDTLDNAADEDLPIIVNQPETEQVSEPEEISSGIDSEEEHFSQPDELTNIAEPEEELPNEVEPDEYAEPTHQPDEVKYSAEDIWAEYIQSTLPVTEETSEDNADYIIEPLITLEEEKEPQIEHQIEDEVYDEIQSIDQINLGNDDQEDEVYDEIQSIEEINRNNDYHAHETANVQVHEPQGATSQPDAPLQPERKPRLIEEEKLILGNIAATDFFVFDRTFSDRNKAEANAGQAKSQENTAVATKEKQVVSKYNDDKMPYSFMWWLDKTRKEHAGIYQPYVNFTLDTTQSIKNNAPDELQHQYVENIFHLTSVEDLDRSTGNQPLEFDPKRKEDEIIERFIQEVPQIKPLSGDKLDNENKAKKSSEDANEIVTETLAHIYADQMLYHKAINTYKKLMLKFPEKSRYFASQIEELEKKTN